MTTDQWIAVMGIAVAATTAIGIPVISAVMVLMFKIRGDHAQIKEQVIGFKEHKAECVEDRKKIHSEVNELKVGIAGGA